MPIAVGVLVVLVVLGAALVVALLVHRAAGPAPVTTPFLTYTPPSGWSAAAPDPAVADAPALVGVVHGARYPCDGEELVRGFAAAALLPTDATASPAERAQRVARWFADATFPAADGTPPEVTVAPPRPVQVAGPDGPVDGTVTEAAVRAPGGRGGCAATAGRVLVLAVPHAAGVALLLVAADTDGGPADPAPPEPSTLDGVVGSVRIVA